jgi:hypothetical protein
MIIFKDHVGNVRVVLTEEQKTDMYPAIIRMALKIMLQMPVMKLENPLRSRFTIKILITVI